MKFFLLYAILLISLHQVSSEFTIVSPSDLVDKFKSKERQVEHAFGNFGKVLYGHTLVGTVFFNSNTKDNNQFCDVNKLPDFNFNFESTPIILVKSGGDCSIAEKALHVELVGGKAMLLMSNEEDLLEHLNKDYKIGERVSIPSIIIKKSVGEIIKHYSVKYEQNKESVPVKVAIKFQELAKGDNAKIDFFLRSDDKKSANFFEEFYTYFQILKDDIKFEPIYKYYKCEGNGQLCGEEEIRSNCVDNGKYCAEANEKYGVNLGKQALAENVRQKCVWYSTKDTGLSQYWKYMIKFNDQCAYNFDEAKSNFTDQCADKILSQLGLHDKVTECLKKRNAFIESDMSLFNKNKIYRTPVLNINNMSYKVLPFI